MTPRPNDVRSIQQALRDLGWPIAVDGKLGIQTHAAVSDFQRAYTYIDLLVDGWAGVQTCMCLIYAQDRGLSPHFRASEFKSHGNGWIKQRREQIRGLEVLRSVYYPGGLAIESPYRDPAYNASIGAVSNSQHIYGNADDIPPRCTVAQVKRLQRFSGIGFNESSGKVCHVDVRHVGPNTTGGTPQNPTVWRYAR